MIYGYARVSTAAQDHAGQVADLTAAGCDQVVTEKLSAASGKRRPAFDQLVSKLQAGDVLVVRDLNRFARSARDALNTIAEISEKGAGFRSLGQPWADTTTMAGRLMVTVFSGLAEYDREQILQRTSQGRASAAARGVRMGRRPTLTRDQVAFVLRARSAPPENRMTIGELQQLLGVGRSTICRAAKTPADQLTDLLRPASGQLDIEDAIRTTPPAPGR